MVTIEQIIAFIEILHSEVRRTSKKKKLVFIDCAAGNCYLSYLLYHFYNNMENREIEIHCIDNDDSLIANNKEMAQRLNFNGMYFHFCNIKDFKYDTAATIVYTMQGLGTDTDETMYLGIKQSAQIILSVACNQDNQNIEQDKFQTIFRHDSFKNRILNMITDSLRALILEKKDFRVDIFDFVSSRFTDKNIIIRAVKRNFKKQIDANEEYKKISKMYGIKPYLAELLNNI